MKNKEKKNPIEEARRYVDNAKETIEKAVYDPEIKSYSDSKYIKTAGDILWKGCLIALDAVLWAMMVRRTRKSAKLALKMQMQSLNAALCCIISLMLCVHEPSG